MAQYMAHIEILLVNQVPMGLSPQLCLLEYMHWATDKPLLASRLKLSSEFSQHLYILCCMCHVLNSIPCITVIL